MNEHIFDYNDRPVILVDFLAPDEKISIASLIDSGADMSVSFKEIGEFLGIKFSGKPDQKIESFGRTLKGWKREVEIEFLGQKLSLNVIWITRAVNVEKDIPMIIGRNPLFDRFNIEFKENRKMIFRNNL